MQVIQMDEIEKTALKDPIFTGEGVKFQQLVPDSTDFQINIVHFAKGVRNKLHYHSSEQILVVTSGTGIVATETDSHVVSAGDMIRIPAGEKHWHGATAESAFSHLYIMPKVSELTQVEF